MKNEFLKLKKYLLLISIVFFFVPLSHLIYVYLYHDADLIPVEGGSISEGLIGNFPSLNPLKPLTGNNKYMVELLYRGLLKYDIENEKITSDLASCDISNLLYIECYLENNITWSNGREISTQDIVSTYQILQNTNINPIIQSLLSETEITRENNIITLKNQKSDINFLNVLFQPILPKEIIDEMGEENLKGSFPTINGIYSGKYKMVNVSRDLAVGVTKFILEKNENYIGNPVIVEQIVLKLFATPNDLIRNKDSINIFNDTNNLIGSSMPRFDVQKYHLPQYVGLFLNKEMIPDVSLRSFLLNQMDNENLLKILGEEQFEGINNPYLSGASISGDTKNKNLENMISKLGYYKKSKFLEDIEKEIPGNTYSQEANIEATNTLSGSESDGSTPGEEKTFEDLQQDSEFIILPEYVDKYNFITNNKVILKGVVPENTSEVYMNDQKIESFQTGNRYFYFPLEEDIEEGENTYEIYFTINDEKKLFEEVNFMYYQDKKILEEQEALFVEKIIQEAIQAEQEALAALAIEEEKIPNEKLEAVNELDENLYYNKDLEVFSMDLVYILGESAMEKTAIYVKNTLESIGIHIRLRPIALNQLKQIMGEDKDYHMILAGIHLGYFPFNLFPYFHSSQVKSGYNFSNIRKTSLDILLEELKGDMLPKTSIIPIQDKILDILQKEQVVKTLYTPKIDMLVDKNIKNSLLPSYIPHKSLRSEIFNTLYILDKKIINFENKSFGNFISFIIQKFND